ncbi:MAG: hypothetical protein AAB631_03245 [Patescibacteria group bacterium]
MKTVISFIAFFAITGAALAQPTPVPFQGAREVLREGKKETVEQMRDARKDVRQEVRDVQKNVRENIRDVHKDVREEVRDVKRDLNEARKEGVQNLREEIKNTREDAKKAFEAKREEMKQVFEAKREEMKKAFEVKREEFKFKMETVREEAKKKIENAREKLKEKVRELRDTRREEVVNRVDENLGKLNTRWTDHFLDVLDQVGEVLVRIKARTDDVASRGINVADVRTAITVADTAIQNAQAAVKAQSGKTYPITWTASTTPAVVKDAVQAARDALRKDLEATRTVVQGARDAVHTAAVALAKARGAENPLVVIPTSTPTSTATTSTP